MTMVNHIEGRERIISTLKEELIGPSLSGEEIDCEGEIVFTEKADSYKPFRQAGSGEEILQHDAPLNRYGAGVLYPYGEPGGDTELVSAVAPVVPQGNDETIGSDDKDPLTENAAKNLAALEARGGAKDEGADLDLSAANKFLPSSMGVSFLAEFPTESELVIEATCGRYVRKTIKVEGGKRDWWLRIPVRVTVRFAGERIAGMPLGKVDTADVLAENAEGLDLRAEVFVRSRKRQGLKLVTVCFINRTVESGQRDEQCVFQSHFRASVISPGGRRYIMPYPEAEAQMLDEEEQSLALLYRNTQTFAVGHGCAADWGDTLDGKAGWVSGECFPVYETPSITPDVEREDGTRLEISMRLLAGLESGSDGIAELEELVSEYERWIGRRREEIETLDDRYREAARRHIADCERCAARMRDGLTYLLENENARLAFRLANQAVLIQQLRTENREPRLISYNPAAKRFEFSDPYPTLNLDVESKDRGKWRAFQVAFLLMTLRSAAEGEDVERETVEMIWFPTGGGKTEAYLGLTAFSLFMRRLTDPEDVGVHVLMRYTLRLLTAQQFQRACGLICAMEYLRWSHKERLGDKKFSIAVWLGGSVTPNTRDEARTALRALRSNPNTAENKFIILRCPWCRAQMGVVASTGQNPAGYVPEGNTVVFKCPDRMCDFNGGIPVYVVDDDMYATPPSFVIGTVDKFAMLAWNKQARALFGIGPDGERRCSPPGLIIQDELHLISGPLGSVVGLYESIIEELCTDRRGGRPVPPKIVSSTATIRRFQDQIRALYARTNTTLFPPPGLDAGDSFFARFARNEDGTLKPGRKYVGVNTPGLGSLQNTEVRTYTALLQAPMGLTPEAQDPWWTLLIFFNNLRMLGNTLSLFQSIVPNYIKVFNNRTRQQVRYVDRVEELTGRLRSDEVPGAMAKLEVSTTSRTRKPVDVCLASNIIEVGVDIDRLSLIVVVGQPKSTSQYIQVTGRVGRRWWERPGVVVSVYSPSKPRDRSHFEKFRSYHERLYAQVEPTSVTPFSPPALERALHAVMVAYVRQTGDEARAGSPTPYPSEMIDDLRDILLPRVRAVDPDEEETFEQIFDRRADEWRRWERMRWDGSIVAAGGDMPLLRPAGGWVSAEDALVSWSTPQSMRNVDAEGQVEITRLYITEGGEA
jgi:hypothetical protein